MNSPELMIQLDNEGFRGEYCSSWRFIIVHFQNSRAFTIVIQKQLQN